MKTIENTNGRDNATCPRCRHYNAMLGTGRYLNGNEVYKCRDCGEEAFVAEPEEAEECTGDCDGQCEECFEKAIDRADMLMDMARDAEMGI